MYQDHVHYNLRKYFFANRVICTWNSLPDSVIEANSVDSFKNRIDNYWNNFEFKYNWKADPTGPEAVVKVFKLIFCKTFSYVCLRGIGALSGAL